jgi:hypothetical protein
MNTSSISQLVKNGIAKTRNDPTLHSAHRSRLSLRMHLLLLPAKRTYRHRVFALELERHSGTGVEFAYCNSEVNGTYLDTKTVGYSIGFQISFWGWT